MTHTNSVYIMIVNKAADVLMDSGKIISWQRPDPIPFSSKPAMLRHAVDLLWPEIQKQDLPSEDQGTLATLRHNHLYADFLDYWERLMPKFREVFSIRLQYDEEPRLIL